MRYAAAPSSWGGRHHEELAVHDEHTASPDGTCGWEGGWERVGVRAREWGWGQGRRRDGGGGGGGEGGEAGEGEVPEAPQTQALISAENYSSVEAEGGAAGADPFARSAPWQGRNLAEGHQVAVTALTCVLDL